jgi:hypothetical protein
MKPTRTRRLVRAFRTWLCLACGYWSSPSHASDVEPDPRAQAIELGKNAIELYHGGNYHLALERFRSAERIRHSPVFVLYLARCSRSLGRLLEARAYYERTAAEVVDRAPAAWKSARDEARLELAELGPRIPSIRVRAGGESVAELRLDGQAIAMADARNELFLDPGEHELQATDTAGSVAALKFTVLEGERLRLVEIEAPKLQESQRPAAPMTNASPVAAKRGAERAPTANMSNPATDTLGVVLLGVGALGVGVGAVTGLMAIGKARAIKDNCEGEHCLASDADEGRAATRLATASDIGFAMGGVALGTWAVRIWVSPSLPDSKTAGVWLAGQF